MEVVRGLDSGAGDGAASSGGGARLSDEGTVAWVSWWTGGLGSASVSQELTPKTMQRITSFRAYRAFLWTVWQYRRAGGARLCVCWP